MVITRLIGGLGNQMFQYACGRRLADCCGVPLKVDVSGFSAYPLRQFVLHKFNIRAEVASPDEVRSFSGSSRIARWLRSRISWGRSLRHYRERSFSFDPALLTADGNVYLDGYWQSEKYFIDIADAIRQDFTLHDLPDGANLALLDSVQACESISLHVRRGDYVSNPETNAVHGVCDVSYYQQAVAHVGERVSSPHFFVFSDDPVWARENLTFSFPTTFVDCNGPDQPQEDLRLMAACRHNILANSSLSWWGAWLNANSGKTVIAPRQWFRDPKVDTGDLIPAGWIRL